MDKTIIGGFVSVKSVLTSKSRQIFKIYLERERYEKIMKSNLRVSEQRQYLTLINSGCEYEFVNADAFEKIMPNSYAGGIAAEVGERIFKNADDILNIKNGYIAILDGIEDPFNFAYALRSLYAAGVDAVILPERNFFSATETVIRSSAGASELINACTVSNLEDVCLKLKTNGYTIASTAKASKSKDLYKCKINRPFCIIFGGEKRGIKQELLNMSDLCIELNYPRNCHYSLPACSAISVIAFECARKLDPRHR